MSAASKIDIQINQKIGGCAWEVVKKHSYFDKRRIMYGGISISKGKQGFTLAFVGTINNECTKVYSYCKYGIKKKEEIPKAIFEAMFVNWAKNYYMLNNDVPSTILMYREGLSLKQIEVQLEPEVEAMYTMIKKISEKTKKPNYNPDFVYMTVNKKINGRFFTPSSNTHSEGKFIPRVNNPDSGSLIM